MCGSGANIDDVLQYLLDQRAHFTRLTRQTGADNFGKLPNLRWVDYAFPCIQSSINNNNNINNMISVFVLFAPTTNYHQYVTNYKVDG